MSDRSLYREHTARREYRCERQCGAPIQEGSRYTVASLPPHSDIGNTSWWSIRIHGRDYDDCPTYHPEALAEIEDIVTKARTS